MPFPSTTYDTTDVTLPNSVLTDFPLMIDLSRLSTAWWDTIDTAEFGRGRAYKEDETELACDWIDIDTVARTGWLRTKWSGSLGGVGFGTATIRVYPPNTANIDQLAHPTFGARQAYKSEIHAYHPFDSEDYTNRTNGVVGTPVDIVTSVTGQAGTAAGLGNRAGYVSVEEFSPASTFTISSWVKWAGPTNVNEDNIFGNWGSNQGIIFRYDSDTSSLELFVGGATIQTLAGTTGTNLVAGEWTHVAATYDGSTMKVYKNGVVSPTTLASTEDPAPRAVSARVGSSPHTSTDVWRGDIDEFILFSAAQSDDWISYEYSLLSDQVGIFGTWTNVPVGSTTVTMNIAVTGDDGAWRNTTAFNTNNPNNNAANTTELASWKVFLYFSGTGPAQGSTVTDAKLRVSCFDVTAQFPRVRIYGILGDTRNAPTSVAEGEAILASSLTTASVLWEAPGGVGFPGYVDSPSITSVIQEILDQPGYTPGDKISLIVQAQAGTSALFRHNSFDSAEPALLEITTGSGGVVVTSNIPAIMHHRRITRNN